MARSFVVLAALALACGETASSAGATDASAEDAAADSSVPDASDGAVPAAPEGTWQIEYGTGCEGAGPDLVFVSAAGTGWRADFADRRPLPSPCGAAGPPDYAAEATFEAATAELVLTLDTSWCFSGESQCDRRRVELTIGGDGASGTLEWTRCWSPDPDGDPVTCSATAARLAEPAECASVTGNETCSGDAVCNSGCGTACRCESGLWNCDYPLLGSLCVAGESCVYKQSALGGFDTLACVDTAGELRFDGSLQSAGSVCPGSPPASGELCGPWPAALACPYPAAGTACSCEAADGGDKAWACTP